MAFKRLQNFPEKSVLFWELPGFHAGIFSDFVIFTECLMKIFAVVVPTDVTPLLVLRVNFYS